MTQTYRSLFSGKELDEAIISMRSLSTPIKTITVADTNSNVVFSFNRKVNNFTKLTILGLTTDGTTGATYIESNITCAVGAQPTMTNRPAVLSGTLTITVAVYLDGDNVQVKVSAPIGTILKIQPIQLI